MSETVAVPTAVRCTTLDRELTDAEFRLEETLVVTAEDLTVEIGLEDIFDIRIGAPPAAADNGFSDRILSVGFDTEDRREVLFVDADEETLERVSGLLYRRVLDGIEVAARHPVEVGGRVTDKSFDIGRLLVAPGKLGCPDIDVPFTIDVDTVVDFSRLETELLGEERPTIKVQYVKNGVAVTLELSLTSPRKQHLLGRFLRYEYDRIREDLKSIDIPDPAGRALVRLYSLRGTAKPQSLLREESVSTAAVLRGLARTDLVEVDEGQVTLTPRGWILVTEHMG